MIRLDGLGGVLGRTIAAAGLAIIAAGSIAVLNGQLPTLGETGAKGGGPTRTATPSKVVVVDPRSNVAGQILYVKDGNLWIQAGAEARQITTGGMDSMPTWSFDGKWIYFIRTAPAVGRWPIDGVPRTFDLEVPAVVRMHPDGSDLTKILSGRTRVSGYSWSSFIRQPVPSPDGSTIALITDHPQPATSDPVLKLLNLKTGGLVNPGLVEVPPLGHQDPAWSPDGRSILYVKDARKGSAGAPILERFDLADGRVKAITGPGYVSASWSPDGAYLAATRTGSFGTDIVVLDARTGAELLRLTNDGSSFDPVWSPAGDSIAFFRVDEGVVDLHLLGLRGPAPTWTLGDDLPMTQSAGLDAGSRVSWFIPPAERASPPPSAAPTAESALP